MAGVVQGLRPAVSPVVVGASLHPIGRRLDRAVGPTKAQTAGRNVDPAAVKQRPAMVIASESARPLLVARAVP